MYEVEKGFGLTSGQVIKIGSDKGMIVTFIPMNNDYPVIRFSPHSFSDRFGFTLSFKMAHWGGNIVIESESLRGLLPPPYTNTHSSKMQKLTALNLDKIIDLVSDPDMDSTMLKELQSLVANR